MARTYFKVDTTFCHKNCYIYGGKIIAHKSLVESDFFSAVELKVNCSDRILSPRLC